MTDLVQQQVKTVRDAHAAHGGGDLVEGDQEVDALCASLFRELFGSTQHLFLHPPDALSQEHRVDGRARHQYRGVKKGAPYRVTRLVGCRRRSTAG